MPRKPAKPRQVATLTHGEATRKNIPTAEYQTMMADEERKPIRVAYERRNRDLDPQLVWRGKDEQNESGLVVQVPPLFIQEKVHPQVLIDDLRQRSKETEDSEPGFQTDLFSDFNGLPSEHARTEFYQHDANWSNRMILGDSLQVMASLAEREGLRGKVQCIYLDPPYGIKFNSNFQWSTTSRDVKDGKAEHITREPEQVKAFRDTWRDGIHSYLTYLRDRLTVARDLLTESGSIFVQIGDENVHRVRAVMDEVFGEENFASLISFSRSAARGTGARSLDNVCDYILWFYKGSSGKYRQLHREVDPRSSDPSMAPFNYIVLPDGHRRSMSKDEKDNPKTLLQDARRYRTISLSAQSRSDSASTAYDHQDTAFKPAAGRGWKASLKGLDRLDKVDRMQRSGKTLNYMSFADERPGIPFTNQWTDTAGVADEKSYVVQTATKVIQRCLLMTTDPGDLVLDPTCGAGTTAYVAEQWGRRWITIDTSRVALALARARIMGARYPYYLLADSPEGRRKEAEISGQASVTGGQFNDNSPTTGHSHSIRQGFVYQRVPHITLKSIANNAEIDVIWEKYEERLAPLREQLSAHRPLEEWEIPRERPEDWPPATEPLITALWKQRIARQKEIDASIAAKADYEYLYDKPYEDNKKVRVAGPFTVESLSPHRLLGVDENDELIIDKAAEDKPDYGEKQDFAEMILDNLKTSGVQQAHKDGKINFSSLVPWPGHLVCAEGRFDSGQWPVISGQKKNAQATEHRAGIFIGPEFGTVSRPDLVSAVREAADAGFDVLITCAFNYDAHASEFNKLGRVPILKARMNADLHMADDLKNTGKGNLFVIFGEPDITVTSGQWLVASNGRMIANYKHVKELSGLGSLEEINRTGGDGLSNLCQVSAGRKIRHNQPGAEGGGIRGSEYRRGSRASRDQGISPISGDSQRFSSRDGDLSDSGAETGNGPSRADQPPAIAGGGRWTDAQWAQTLAAVQKLTRADFPLSLTTGHWSQITVHGVDVFHPNTGEIRSDSTDGIACWGIACWFVDTDYNEESFFVRHAYFLGANNPYKALKTTLKAEVNQEAWETLHSDTSRPFAKPTLGRIAVKVINHLGDEVMKVFRV